MKHEAEIRELLINNTIRLIAEGGFEKATTKEITYCGGNLPDVKMNEVYIYRIFGSKENLYEVVFARLDNEVYQAFRRGAVAVGGFGGGSREKIYEFIRLAWRFILGNEDKCRCYVRYYYSVYFKGSSRDTHRKLFASVISEMAPAFKAEADIVSIMHSVFSTLLDFGIRVYNGDLEDNDDSIEHICNVLYCMMSTYFKDPAEAS